jgi:hypothetical protein
VKIYADFSLPLFPCKWSGNSSKPLASPETETLPTENDKTSLEDSWAKEPSHPSQLRLKQFFPEKDKESDGLAADIRLRRKTNERLYAAVEAYWSSLSEYETFAL